MASTARLVAAWQSVGFVHGVLNTDNMSILGGACIVIMPSNLQCLVFNILLATCCCCHIVNAYATVVDINDCGIHTYVYQCTM